MLSIALPGEAGSPHSAASFVRCGSAVGWDREDWIPATGLTSAQWPTPILLERGPESPNVVGSDPLAELTFQGGIPRSGGSNACATPRGGDDETGARVRRVWNDVHQAHLPQFLHRVMRRLPSDAQPAGELRNPRRSLPVELREDERMRSPDVAVPGAVEGVEESGVEPSKAGQ